MNNIPVLPCGYDSKIFVKNPSDKCSCPLCLNVLKDPRQCPNGHCFCLSCVTFSLNTRLECPVCKCFLTEPQLGRSLYVQSVIEELETFCVSCDDQVTADTDSCKWIGELNARTKHYEVDCGHRIVKCPDENCDVLLERRFLDNHQVTCVFGFTTCEHCSSRLLRKELLQHYSVCSAGPTCCPNNCGEYLSPSQLDTHISTCQLTEVDCPLSTGHLCNNCPGRQTRCVIIEHVNRELSSYQMAYDLAVQNAKLTATIDQMTLQLAQVTTEKEQRATQLKIAFEKELHAMETRTHVSMITDFDSKCLLMDWSKENDHTVKKQKMRLILNKLKTSPEVQAVHTAWEFNMRDIAALSTLGTGSVESHDLVQLTSTIFIQLSIALYEEDGKFEIRVLSSNEEAFAKVCVRVTLLDFNNFTLNQTYTSPITGCDDVRQRISLKHLNALADKSDGKLKILMTVLNANRETCVNYCM